MRKKAYYFTILALFSFACCAGQTGDSLYVRGELEGTILNFRMNGPDSMYISHPSETYDAIGPRIMIRKESSVLHNKAGKTAFGISFLNLYKKETPPSVAESNDFLKKGTYSYSRNPGSRMDATQGVNIYYVDERNYIWESRFELKEISTYKKDGREYTVIHATFSCTLYNMYGEGRKLDKASIRCIMLLTPGEKARLD